MVPEDKAHSEVSTCIIATHGVLRAPSGNQSTDGRQLAAQCVGAIEDQGVFPPRLLVLFATVAFRPFAQLVSGIHAELRAQNLEVPLVGCSVAGAITPEDGVMEDGVLLVCLASRFLTAKVGVARDARAKRKEVVRSLLAQIGLARDEQESDLNPHGNRFLLCFLPGYVNIGGEVRCDAPQIHAALREATQFRVPMVGGVAADKFERKQGWTFADGRVETNGPVVALIESDLRFGIGLSHAFEETGDVLRVHSVSEDGRRISKLERRVGNASETLTLQQILDQYSGDYRAVVFGSTAPEEGLRSILAPRIADDGAVVLTRPVNEGSALEVLTTTPELVKRSREELFRLCMARARIAPFHLACMIAFPCAAKYEYMRPHLQRTDILRLVREKYVGVQIVGGLVFGEIGLGPLGRSLLRNWTTSGVAIGDLITQRALHRRTYAALADAVKRMSKRETEEEILSAALDAITDAGFPGGMISLVYRNRDARVLVAHGARGEGWKRIAPHTERPIDGNDILAIVARNGTSIFVADSRVEPRCDPMTIKRGKIISQYVMALQTDSGEVIGTLQVDLGDLSNLQALPSHLKELLDVFAGQTAAALSYSFRLHDLTLSDLFDRALAASMAAHTAENAAQRFVDIVAAEPRLVGTDMVHIRLANHDTNTLDLVAGSGEYYLAAMREKAVVPIIALPGDADCPTSVAFRQGRSDVVNNSADDEVTRAFIDSLPDGPARHALGDVGAHITCVIQSGNPEDEPIGTISFLTTTPWVFSEGRWRSTVALEKRMFFALKHAEDVSARMQAAQRMSFIGRHLGQVTHDLRSRLFEIQSDVRTLVDEAPAEELKRRASRVERVCESLAGRIAEHLETISSRIRSSPERVELDHVIEKALLRAREKAEARGLTIDYRVGRAVCIRGAPEELVDTFHDIIDNGLNAMEAGGALTIAIEAPLGSREVRVIVADEGRGIAREEIPKILEGFHKFGASGRPAMGLFLARMVVEQHGGRLELHSKVDEGTTVSIILPIIGSINEVD